MFTCCCRTSSVNNTGCPFFLLMFHCDLVCALLSSLPSPLTLLTLFNTIQRWCLSLPPSIAPLTVNIPLLLLFLVSVIMSVMAPFDLLPTPLLSCSLPPFSLSLSSFLFPLILFFFPSFPPSPLLPPPPLSPHSPSGSV